MLIAKEARFDDAFNENDLENCLNNKNPPTEKSRPWYEKSAGRGHSLEPKQTVGPGLREWISSATVTKEVVKREPVNRGSVRCYEIWNYIPSYAITQQKKGASCCQSTKPVEQANVGNFILSLREHLQQHPASEEEIVDSLPPVSPPGLLLFLPFSKLALFVHVLLPYLVGAEAARSSGRCPIKMFDYC